MHIPLSWLNDYIHLSESPEEIARILTLMGLEVDRVSTTPFTFSGVVVAKVETVAAHPDAETLNVATVFDGTDRFQVVCGAKNCRKDMLTAFAKIGAKLQTGGDKKVTIKKGMLRKVASFGMLCSAKELNLSEEDSGILELDDKTPLGMDLTDLYRDTIFEVSLTPNLGYCASLIGIARELSAYLHRPVRLPSFELEKTEDIAMPEVQIENASDCLRYSLRVVRNIKNTTSPPWMQKRLLLANVQSKNLLVDVTNYVRLEYGQPMHAFDLAYMQGSNIAVKRSKETFPFTTLDGVKRTISPNTLMIYAEDRPVAIAGIMGGSEGSVAQESQGVILEAATFAPALIRKTQRQLNLRTDASAQFEKGTDPNATLTALKRACYLLQKYGHGSVSLQSVDIKKQTFEKKKVVLRIDRANQILGTKFSIKAAAELLERISIYATIEGGNLTCSIPTNRNDISQEIDLIEELARIFGLNRIKKSNMHLLPFPENSSKLFLFEREMRSALAAEKLQEWITCDLISHDLAIRFLHAPFTEDALVCVLHPSSVEQSVLRTSLLSSMLLSVKHNFDHQNRSLAVSEIGRIHFREANGSFHERLCAGILLTGATAPPTWKTDNASVSFFDLKGILENIFEKLHLPTPYYKTSTLPPLHPLQQSIIEINALPVGFMGQVHPQTLQHFDIDQPLFFAQIDLHDLLQYVSLDRKMRAIPQFPGSFRDWTIKVDQSTSYQSLHALFHSFPSSIIENITLHDVYIQEKETKNLTFRFSFRHPKKTLQNTAIDKEFDRLIKWVAKTEPDLVKSE